MIEPLFVQDPVDVRARDENHRSLNRRENGVVFRAWKQTAHHCFYLRAGQSRSSNIRHRHVLPSRSPSFDFADESAPKVSVAAPKSLLPIAGPSRAQSVGLTRQEIPLNLILNGLGFGFA